MKLTASALGFLCLLAPAARGQTVPDAPPLPVCAWDGSGSKSTCKFKDAMAGTPTSVVGNRVILYDSSRSGGHGTSRTYLREAVTRLADRYGFTATITRDPSVFSAASLANAKVVILSNGDGDVLSAGKSRTALEDFQQVNGWGLIWIHAACSFITAGWPFAQQSCVQQYFHHNPSGTQRRMFIDSGTAEMPNQGRKNPQSEFLLRDLPGWGGKRALGMADEWFCTQAPARNTEGVNVLFGYDRSSGLPDPSCPQARDSAASGSQYHNMVWTRMMGKGIAIRQSWGHDQSSFTDGGNMGDSLLWRFIRYAAKDWCVSGSGTAGCDAPTAIAYPSPPQAYALQSNGEIVLGLPGEGRFSVTVTDMRGRRVWSRTVSGPGNLEVSGLRRGMYWARVAGAAAGIARAHRIMVY